MSERLRVWMLAANDLANDPRVTRQASLAAREGFAVTVLGIRSVRTRREEERDGYRILRTSGTPAWEERLRGLYKTWFDADPGRNLGDASVRRTEVSRTRASAERPGLGRRCVRLVKEAFQGLRILRYNLALSEAGAGLARPQVVHANDLDTLWAGVRLKEKTGASLVYDAHELWVEQDPESSDLHRGLFGRLEASCLAKCDGVVTVNRSIARELTRRYGCPEVTVVHNCPALDRAGPEGTYPLSREAKRARRGEAGLPDDDSPLVVYQGRYVPHRGLEELILAMSYLRGVHLALRGFGDSEARLRTLVETEHLDHCVHFLPPVSMNDMVDAAALGDIGIVPYRPVSLNNELCTPNKVFEYMMAGLPMAASDLPELTRFVKENELGDVFDPDRPEDIARAIEHVLSSGDFLREAGGRAARLARSRYNWEAEASRLLDLYRRVAG